MPTLPPALRNLVAVAAVASGLAVAVGRLLDGLGLRRGEQDAALPGDHLHPPDALVRTRAVTIAAPPGEVWPWLVQLGWGRAGWYSIDALERLLGAARAVNQDGTVSWRSLRHIVPAHQALAVGDRLPLHEGIGLEVVAIEPEQHLVVTLACGPLRMVWTLALVDHGEATRLVARTALSLGGSLGPAALRLLLDPGHGVMEVVQLRGIKGRAEGYLTPTATATGAARTGRGATP